jgi:hypothetical protein
MYALNLETVNALEILERSLVCHPTLFREALEREAASDLVYAEGKDRATYRAVMARHNASRGAANAVDNPETAISYFRENTGAGIVALNIACKLQCIPRHVRTSAAVRTWG